mgnify:CR=1 FL=1
MVETCCVALSFFPPRRIPVTFLYNSTSEDAGQPQTLGAGTSKLSAFLNFTPRKLPLVYKGLQTETRKITTNFCGSGVLVVITKLEHWST